MHAPQWIIAIVLLFEFGMDFRVAKTFPQLAARLTITIGITAMLWWGGFWSQP